MNPDCREGYPIVRVAECLGVTLTSLRSWARSGYVTVLHKEGKEVFLGQRGVLEALCLSHTRRNYGDQPDRLQEAVDLLTAWVERQPGDPISAVVKGMHIFINDSLVYDYMTLAHWTNRGRTFVIVPIGYQFNVLMENLADCMVPIHLSEESGPEVSRPTPVEVTIARSLLDSVEQVGETLYHETIEEAIRLITGA